MKSIDNSLFVILILLLSAADSFGQGSWQTLEPADGANYIPKDEASMSIVNDKIYLIGGRERKPTNIYDLNSNTWKVGTQPPIEMHHFQAVTVGNKIYVVGAFTGGYPDETPLPNIYIYDPGTDSWSVGPEIPSHRRRGACGVTVIEGKIYVVAGITDGHKSGHVTWFDEFDPGTEEWKALPDTPRPRDHFQVAAVDGKLYVTGGRTSRAPDRTFVETIPELDIYDFEKGQWSTFSQPIPTQRAGTATVSLGKYIVIIGGESGSQAEAHSETQAFDTQAQKWIEFASLNQGRHGLGAVTVGGKIYVAGGNGNRGAGKPLESLEILTVRPD